MKHKQTREKRQGEEVHKTQVTGGRKIINRRKEEMRNGRKTEEMEERRKGRTGSRNNCRHNRLWSEKLRDLNAHDGKKTKTVEKKQ